MAAIGQNVQFEGRFKRLDRYAKMTGDYCVSRTCFAGNDLLHAASRLVPAPTTCGRGGIGRRAALRSLWGNPWKFESSRPHQYLLKQAFGRLETTSGNLAIIRPSTAPAILQWLDRWSVRQFDGNDEAGWLVVVQLDLAAVALDDVGYDRKAKAEAVLRGNAA